MGSKDDFVLQDEQDTKTKLEEIEKNVHDNKDEVIQHILALVHEIKPELHQNVRLQTDTNIVISILIIDYNS